MAKRFAGFTPDQLGKIVPEMAGMQSDEQAKFLAATPSAAARVNMMSEKARAAIEKPIGMADGGVVNPNQLNFADTYNYDVGPAPVEPIKPEDTTINTITYKQDAPPQRIFTGVTEEWNDRMGIMEKKYNYKPNPAYAAWVKDPYATRLEGPGVEYQNQMNQYQQDLKAYQDAQAAGEAIQSVEAAPYDLDLARRNVVAMTSRIAGIKDKLDNLGPDEDRTTYEEALARAEVDMNRAENQLQLAQQQFQTLNTTSTQEMMATAIKTPEELVTKSDVEKVATSPDQMISAETGQLTGEAPTVTPTTAEGLAPVTAPTTKEAPTVDVTTATADVKDTLAKLEAATGKPSAEALADAATMTPDQLAQLGLTAAQIDEAVKVQAPEARTLQEGELISGPSVDMGRVEQAVNFEAATGAPSTDATVQGQLTGLMEQFEGGATPAWAAGAMRAAAAQMAARGLSASSIAGQATVQAAMESALPIAQADAATVAKFESQNLSNKQQAALFAAEQRAQFLNLEFTQDFQTKVANAAKITEIANANYSTEVQIALENSRNAQSVQLANMNAQNAKILADAAAMTQLDMTNLNNRQQAQVVNAKAFLDMDMANLNNEQQTEMFKTQSVVNSILSDQAATNAAEQFNATSEMQTNQFYDNLTSTVAMFNAEQKSVLDRFNAGELNAAEEFNATIKNMREQFNASNSLVVEQANAKWLQEVSTMDTAAQNLANRDYAQAATEMTSLAFNGLLQENRDMMSFAWQTENNNADRSTQLAIANIQSADAKEAAAAERSSGFWSALGNVAAAATSAWITKG
jgi:hypothetical protein